MRKESTKKLPKPESDGSGDQSNSQREESDGEDGTDHGPKDLSQMSRRGMKRARRAGA